MTNKYPELASKKRTAFELPKMTCRELFYDVCTKELEELRDAKHHLAFTGQIRMNTNVCLLILEKKNF